MRLSEHPQNFKKRMLVNFAQSLSNNKENSVVIYNLTKKRYGGSILHPSEEKSS